MKKRSFIAAIAMLVVSAIVLTSATFAWFSMGDTVSVQTFSANVIEADGLKISADNGGSWGTSVSLSQVQSYGAYKNIVYGDTAKMSPVSGNGDYKGTWYTGQLIADTPVVQEMVRSGDGTLQKDSFYCFPLWIQYDGTGSPTISLDGTKSYIHNKTTNSKNAVAAARLAIYSGENMPNDAKIYAVEDTSYTYVTSTNLKNITIEGQTVKSYNTPLTSLESRITNTISDLSFVINTPGTAQKIWVVLWLEGTDEDCIDTVAAGGDLEVNLVFVKS